MDQQKQHRINKHQVLNSRHVLVPFGEHINIQVQRANNGATVIKRCWHKSCCVNGSWHFEIVVESTQFVLLVEQSSIVRDHITRATSFRMQILLINNKWLFVGRYQLNQIKSRILWSPKDAFRQQRKRSSCSQVAMNQRYCNCAGKMGFARFVQSWHIHCFQYWNSSLLPSTIRQTSDSRDLFFSLFHNLCRVSRLSVTTTNLISICQYCTMSMCCASFLTVQVCRLQKHAQRLMRRIFNISMRCENLYWQYQITCKVHHL